MNPPGIPTPLQRIAGKNRPATARRVSASALLGISALLAGAPSSRLVLPPQASVRAGFVVWIGNAPADTLEKLRSGKRVIVQALTPDPAAAARARRRLAAQRLSGPVTVSLWTTPGRLPYPDNLVNLLFCSQPLGKLSQEEVLRVLAPRGTAWFREASGWKSIRKPVPTNTGEWTHYMHGPDGNPVARDTVVAPPKHVQWIEPPRHTRSHEHTPGIQALVSANGRLFYIEDAAPIDDRRAPPRWQLVARDAYNGLLLWKRPIKIWFPALFNWGRVPTFLQRRLVAVGNRVFATLGLDAAISRLDARTGAVEKVYPGTEGAQEIVVLDHTLLLSRTPITPARIAEIAKVERLARRTDSPLYKRETAAPIEKEFMRAEFWKDRALLALDTETGDVLWEKHGRNTARLHYLSLRAIGNRVFYQNGPVIACVDRRSGKPLWSIRGPAPLRAVGHGLVITAGRHNVFAYTLAAGKRLWKQPLLIPFIRDVFLINNSLWIGGFKPYDTGRRYTGPVWGPYFLTQRDLRTGKVIRHITPPNPGHHHRCWLNKATSRYIIAGRRGAEFFDVKTGDLFWNDWVRGVCRYGTLPCNGLLYAPPHACGCYITAKLDGFYALSGEKDAPLSPKTAPLVLRAPALSGNRPDPPQAPPISPEDWPMYRHDPARSGHASSAVPNQLQILWNTSILPAARASLTSPVAAGNRVYVADRESHILYALDAATGKILWQYVAGGRIDSPPTVFQDRLLFGVRDGSVVCLHAADGTPAWRLFPEDPEERFVMAGGQPESARPISGSILINHGEAWFVNGRSSYLDGGILLWRIRPTDGKVLSRTVVYSPDPKTGKQPPASGPSTMPGVKTDLLVGDESRIYLIDKAFDLSGSPVAPGRPHLMALTGFLDDAWPHRSYWCYAVHPSISIGCGRRARHLIYGRLLAFDAAVVYGYGRGAVHWSNPFRDGPYRLFAVQRSPYKPLWQRRVPIEARALLLAPKALVAAGPRLQAPGLGPLSPAAPRPKAQLLLLSPRDGKLLAPPLPLPAAPVLDGMAVARNHIYLAAVNGAVFCLGKK